MVRTVIVRPASPRQLPDLRLDLLRAWAYGAPLSVHAAVLVETGSITGLNRAQPDVRVVVDELRGHLAAADLWWVTGDMCDLVDGAATTVPDETVLEAELVPTRRALVVFARPLATHTIQGVPLHVDAMTWTLGQSVAGDLLTCQFYRWVDVDDGDLSAVEVALTVELGINVIYMSGSEWLVGTAITDMARVGSVSAQSRHEHRHLLACPPEQEAQSRREDRNLLACLWLLAAQPGIATATTQPADKHTRRRSARHNVSSDVRLIALRRHDSASDSGDDGPVRGPMSVRVPVRGYWRSQPYGPGQAYRRPQFVRAHVRGPDDAPLRVQPAVHVLDVDR